MNTFVLGYRKLLSTPKLVIDTDRMTSSSAEFNIQLDSLNQ